MASRVDAAKGGGGGGFTQHTFIRVLRWMEGAVVRWGGMAMKQQNDENKMEKETKEVLCTLRRVNTIQ